MRSIFDDDVSCCMKFMLGEYEVQIAMCFKNDTITLHYQSDWQNIMETGTLNKSIQSAISTRASPGAVDIVSPLLTSMWGQSISNDGVCDAYNFYVTNTSSSCSCNNRKCSAGCVAVAMAQVMYYWKYPVYHTTRYVMDFDWCNMVDELNTTSPDYINERNAVARLIADCGIAADMNYCSDGCASGTTTNKARNALVSSFWFHSGADKQNRALSSDKNWIDRIKSDLDKGWPVIYGGQSSLLFPDNSHSFVCDGYDSNDFFHFNFGWRGTSDNWFTINNLTPSGHNYNSLQDAIFYLRPSIVQDYCDFELSLLDHYAGMQRDYETMYSSMGLPIPQWILDYIPTNVPKYSTTLTSAYPSVVPGLGTVPSSWYTINSGETREYVAHESIDLMPGFEVKAGATFTARIEPCVNCISSRVMINHVGEDGLEIAEECHIIIENYGAEELLGGDEAVDNELQVYPNPITGLLTIHAEKDCSRIQMVEIYSMQEEILFSINGNDSFFQEIDIFHLPSQMYILNIIVNEQLFTKKIIMEKS